MPTQADESALKNLLRLQSEDTEIKRLRDRRESLPEAARLAEVNSGLAELAADLAIARKQLDEVEREQSRLEGEIELLSGKTEREEQRLFSGGVSNPKELSSLQAEVESLKRRRGDLEDKLLEVMVNRDSAFETVESLEKERSAASLESEDLTARVGELSGEIDAALAQHEARRKEITAVVDGELLTLYEGIRDAKHWVGAAELVGDTCQGCHTQLPAREVERLHNERGLQRCDNCRRILVVT